MEVKAALGGTMHPSCNAVKVNLEFFAEREAPERIFERRERADFLGQIGGF